MIQFWPQYIVDETMTAEEKDQMEREVWAECQHRDGRECKHCR